MFNFWLVGYRWLYPGLIFETPPKKNVSLSQHPIHHRDRSQQIHQISEGTTGRCSGVRPSR